MNLLTPLRFSHAEHCAAAPVLERIKQHTPGRNVDKPVPQASDIAKHIIDEPAPQVARIAGESAVRCG